MYKMNKRNITVFIETTLLILVTALFASGCKTSLRSSNKAKISNLHVFESVEKLKQNLRTIKSDQPIIKALISDVLALEESRIVAILDTDFVRFILSKSNSIDFLKPEDRLLLEDFPGIREGKYKSLDICLYLLSGAKNINIDNFSKYDELNKSQILTRHYLSKKTDNKDFKENYINAKIIIITSFYISKKLAEITDQQVSLGLSEGTQLQPIKKDPNLKRGFATNYIPGFSSLSTITKGAFLAYEFKGTAQLLWAVEELHSELKKNVEGRFFDLSLQDLEKAVAAEITRKKTKTITSWDDMELDIGGGSGSLESNLATIKKKFKDHSNLSSLVQSELDGRGLSFLKAEVLERVLLEGKKPTAQQLRDVFINFSTDDLKGIKNLQSAFVSFSRVDFPFFLKRFGTEALKDLAKTDHKKIAELQGVIEELATIDIKEFQDFAKIAQSFDIFDTLIDPNKKWSDVVKVWFNDLKKFEVAEIYKFQNIIEIMAKMEPETLAKFINISPKFVSASEKSDIKLVEIDEVRSLKAFATNLSSLEPIELKSMISALSSQDDVFYQVLLGEKAINQQTISELASSMKNSGIENIGNMIKSLRLINDIHPGMLHKMYSVANSFNFNRDLKNALRLEQVVAVQRHFGTLLSVSPDGYSELFNKIALDAPQFIDHFKDVLETRHGIKLSYEESSLSLNQIEKSLKVHQETITKLTNEDMTKIVTELLSSDDFFETRQYESPSSMTRTDSTPAVVKRAKPSPTVKKVDATKPRTAAMEVETNKLNTSITTNKTTSIYTGLKSSLIPFTLVAGLLAGGSVVLYDGLNLAEEKSILDNISSLLDKIIFKE